jgi:hypothetical protein
MDEVSPDAVASLGEFSNAELEEEMSNISIPLVATAAFSNAERMKPPVRIRQKMLTASSPGEWSTDLALERDAEMARFSPTSPPSPGKFSDPALEDWIASASPPTNQRPPALLSRAAAASSKLPVLAKTEERAAEDTAMKENSEPNIQLTTKRNRQKLGDVSVHLAERPLQ